MLRLARAFWKDERGIALILVSIMLPAIIGFALLAIDMSRANNLHNDLQKAADSFALAAAAELDGGPDSWARAERAMATLVDNISTFSTAGSTTLNAGQPGGAARCNSAGSISWCFLKDIPASDSTAITSANYADADPAVGRAETAFIRVNVQPTAFATIFPASFLTGSTADNAMNIGAEAVAGFRSGVCDFTPVFICNPYEMVGGVNDAGGITLQQAAASRQYRRRLIELRKVGNGAAAGPGNFGFLEPPEGVGNGAQALAETIATSQPSGCYSSGKVTTKTGQNAGPVQDAFNVRFGIKASGNHFDSAIYGPAENVRKGAIQTKGSANQCPAYNQIEFGLAGNAGFPRDTSWPYMGGRMGSGSWDFTPYWETNFGGSTDYPTDWDSDAPTRFDIYRYEIEAELTGTVSPGGESGDPDSDCQPPISVETIDRRLVYGAIVNCTALTAAGNDLSGHSENLPVEAFGSFFLAEPVSSPSDDASVMVELVDVSVGGRGTLDNFVRDEAQLYR
ncbi:pilus assembly protein TadG-related protein [Mesorhizobium sp. KR9-304]|uniref:TadE/TadG family type IV pilus assembly protein n=1 Tax=Mesorhizobium sp. KR9-304 TaxID=3156614 RepID=UPI0032B50E98